MGNWQRVEIEFDRGKTNNDPLSNESNKCQDSLISNEDHEFPKLKQKVCASTQKCDKDNNLNIRFRSPLQIVNSQHSTTSVVSQPSKVLQ